MIEDDARQAARRLKAVMDAIANLNESESLNRLVALVADGYFPRKIRNEDPANNEPDPSDIILRANRFRVALGNARAWCGHALDAEMAEAFGFDLYEGGDE